MVNPFVKDSPAYLAFNQLNKKQRVFFLEWTTDRNGSRAYKQAYGLTAEWARFKASDLLATDKFKPIIEAYEEKVYSESKSTHARLRAFYEDALVNPTVGMRDKLAASQLLGKMIAAFKAEVPALPPEPINITIAAEPGKDPLL